MSSKSITLIRDNLNRICTLSKHSDKETYELARSAMQELKVVDKSNKDGDYFRPDAEFNPPGKTVVRSSNGRVVGLQG